MKCIEPNCNNKAGTKWSPLWCPACNAVRMAKISASLNEMRAKLLKKETSK